MFSDVSSRICQVKGDADFLKWATFDLSKYVDMYYHLFQLGFSSCKAQQLLWGIESEEKEAQRV